MSRHYGWITTTLFVLFLTLGLGYMIYSSIYFDSGFCDCYNKTAPCVNILPFTYLLGYIFSVITLRNLNLKLHKINKNHYVKKEWIWLFPVLNTISIPFALFDLIMESKWGIWFRKTQFYKVYIGNEEEEND